MKRLIYGLAGLMCVATIHWASAQPVNPGGPTTEGPGTGGISKPGVPGKPGSKSGSTVTPSGQQPQNDQQQAEKRKQDETGVQSKPETESGPASKAKPTHEPDQEH